MCTLLLGPSFIILLLPFLNRESFLCRSYSARLLLVLGTFEINIFPNFHMSVTSLQGACFLLDDSRVNYLRHWLMGEWLMKITLVDLFKFLAQLINFTAYVRENGIWFISLDMHIFSDFDCPGLSCVLVRSGWSNVQQRILKEKENTFFHRHEFCLVWNKIILSLNIYIYIFVLSFLNQSSK